MTPEERDELRERASRVAEQMGTNLPLRDADKPKAEHPMNDLIRRAARRQPRETTEGETRDA